MTAPRTCGCLPPYFSHYSNLQEATANKEILKPWCVTCYDCDGKMTSIDTKAGKNKIFGLTLTCLCRYDELVVHAVSAIFCEECSKKMHSIGGDFADEKDLSKKIRTHFLQCRFLRFCYPMVLEKFHSDKDYQRICVDRLKTLSTRTDNDAVCANPVCGAHEVVGTVPFRVCSACKQHPSKVLVYYCRTMCQQQHWNSGHRTLCLKNK